MRIESVTAVAFGPLRNLTLKFAGQLTVIHGPNESGKSSWHAAIYAALCGMRRGKGKSKEDREFAERRQPWSGGEWEVRGIVRLDSGRRVELRQNLADLTDCSAMDADLGRDVLEEIENEQTPDATKWLGLNRDSFLSVACVRQTDIQRVADEAASLQDELQRAAATAARDATAAQATARLVEFQREMVGKQIANSTKPLQVTKVQLARAEEALAEARRMHAEWLLTEVRAKELRTEADEKQRQLHQLRSQRAWAIIEETRVMLERTRELTAKFPGGQPGSLPDDEALAGDVAAALSEWDNRPEVPVLHGESAASIWAKANALPSMPDGDLLPAADVVVLKRNYERSTDALELHLGQQPSEGHSQDPKGLTPDQLRDLALALEIPIPRVDTRLEAESASARLAADKESAIPRPFVAGMAVIALLGGGYLLISGNTGTGTVIALIGVIALVWLAFRGGGEARARAIAKLDADEVQLRSQRQAREAATERVAAARSQIKQLALPTDSRGLRQLADDVVLAEGIRDSVTQWSERHELLRSDVDRCHQQLHDALTQKGVRALGSLIEGYKEYEQACQLRSTQAGRASERPLLEGQAVSREAAEQAVRETEARLETARRRLLDTASRCGHVVGDAESAIRSLRNWQAARRQTLASFESASMEYAELSALLNGGSLADLDREYLALESTSSELAARAADWPQVLASGDLADSIKRLETSADEAAHAATAAESQAQERGRALPSVSETEEAVASAGAAFDRVRRLNQTLGSALEFLKAAEDRVHRDLAPVLAAGLREWLPAITLGRYTDARVDPGNLNVQVLGPDHQWHDAQQLSYGTAEQIYLLLRIVLADRLVTTSETCPLILDDVLVHCDRARKGVLLETLLAVSRSRQVILFTQEEDVLQWAQQNLPSEVSRLEMLPSPV